MDMDRQIMIVKLAEEQDKLDHDVSFAIMYFSQKQEEANNAQIAMKEAIEKRDAMMKVRKLVLGVK